MLPIYMAFWSIIILFLGLTRVRNLAQIIIASLVTALVLLISQVLFAEFSAAAGLYPDLALSNPNFFLTQGMMGWLALLVLPCGWLGPIIGLHLAQRWHPNRQEAF
ncbi:MAG: hypothetical protein P8183_12010 [Anaerolineae bacterium]|jgi:hypothetical protein